MLKNPRILGLAGYPLGHSFSPAYFGEKFKALGLKDWEYRLLEAQNPKTLKELIRPEDGWLGFNVTIPHKQSIMQLLDSCDSIAAGIGAVNVVKILPDGCWRGYNTDYFGFLHSLLQWLPFHEWKNKNALVFGSGGSSLAVTAVLRDLGIVFKTVSRQSGLSLKYQELSSADMKAADLLVQTTPLGMYPETEAMIPIPLEGFFQDQMVMDLIYNPVKTRFLATAESQGAKIQNGLPMLHAQAEKAWEIWNQ